MIKLLFGIFYRSKLLEQKKSLENYEQLLEYLFDLFKF